MKKKNSNDAEQLIDRRFVIVISLYRLRRRHHHIFDSLYAESVDPYMRKKAGTRTDKLEHNIYTFEEPIQF